MVPEGKTHVDDWLDAPARNDAEFYAKTCLEIARAPAHGRGTTFRLFCTYGQKRYRVTGASRLGDVWLTENPQRTYGYELRVYVDDLSNWSSSFD